LSKYVLSYLRNSVDESVRLLHTKGPAAENARFIHNKSVVFLAGAALDLISSPRRKL